MIGTTTAVRSVPSTWAIDWRQGDTLMSADVIDLAERKAKAQSKPVRAADEPECSKAVYEELESIFGELENHWDRFEVAPEEYRSRAHVMAELLPYGLWAAGYMIVPRWKRNH